MKEYIKKEKKGTFKLLLRVILHPCERKYIINWLLKWNNFYHMETAMHLNQVDQATMSQFDCGTTWQGYDKSWPSSKST